MQTYTHCQLLPRSSCASKKLKFHFSFIVKMIMKNFLCQPNQSWEHWGSAPKWNSPLNSTQQAFGTLNTATYRQTQPCLSCFITGSQDSDVPLEISAIYIFKTQIQLSVAFQGSYPVKYIYCVQNAVSAQSHWKFLSHLRLWCWCCFAFKGFQGKDKDAKADTQYLEVSLPFRLRMRCEQPGISCRWDEDKIQIIQDVAS